MWDSLSGCRTRFRAGPAGRKAGCGQDCPPHNARRFLWSEESGRITREETDLQGEIVQVNLSRGGLPKRAVAGAFLTPLGFEGDEVAHPGIHGGPLKAVLLIAAETIDELAARGYPVDYGAMGENLTTRGIDPRQLRSGQRFRVGQAVIELTKLRAPCRSLDVYGPDLAAEIYDAAAKAGDPSSPVWAKGGFYASVVRPGFVRAHDIIGLTDAAV